MNKLGLFLKTARLPNLIMLALVQLIVLMCFVQQFTGLLYVLTALSTVLIAFGGYVLNDVEDLAIDQLNGKLRWVSTHNKSKARIIAFGSIGLGLLLGLALCLTTNLVLFTYYFLASGILVAYAFGLSKYKYLGNILISAVIAMAIILSFYLGVNHAVFTRKFYSFSEIGVWVYAGIAFLLNWIREIIKDLEDIEGDKQASRKSLAIVLGLRLSKSIVFVVLLFFLGIFALWLFKHNGLYLRLYLATLIILNLATMFQVIRSKDAVDFKWSSALIKLLMLTGLLVPFSEIL